MAAGDARADEEAEGWAEEGETGEAGFQDAVSDSAPASSDTGSAFVDLEVAAFFGLGVAVLFGLEVAVLEVAVLFGLEVAVLFGLEVAVLFGLEVAVFFYLGCWLLGGGRRHQQRERSGINGKVSPAPERDGQLMKERGATHVWVRPAKPRCGDLPAFFFVSFVVRNKKGLVYQPGTLFLKLKTVVAPHSISDRGDLSSRSFLVVIFHHDKISGTTAHQNQH